MEIIPGDPLSFRQLNMLLAFLVVAGAAFSSDKLIALTFDDGPRPYVLFGSKGEHPGAGLLSVLDGSGVKATFFVVGWRLTPKTWGEPRAEENVGITCIEAAQRLVREGYELEDHTYSHIELRTAERRRGEQWVLNDVNRGAEAIKTVTGTRPHYLRPPDWIITDDARRDLERQGYQLLSISSENSIALRDVNSLDYLCAGKHPAGCPKPSLADGVLKQIEQREKRGVYTHILAFHELSSTTSVMPELISELKMRGYRFVTLICGWSWENGEDCRDCTAKWRSRSVDSGLQSSTMTKFSKWLSWLQCLVFVPHGILAAVACWLCWPESDQDGKNSVC